MGSSQSNTSNQNLAKSDISSVLPVLFEDQQTTLDKEDTSHKEIDSSPAIESSPKSNIPTTIENFHARAKDVFPTVFEGAKFVLQKPLSQRFQVSHHFSFNNKDANYKYGATLVGSPRPGGPPDEIYPIVLAELSPRGQLQTQLVHELVPGLRSKLMVQMSAQKTGQLQMSHEARLGKRWLAGVTLVNPSCDLSRFIAVTDLSCELNRRATLANQLMVQRSPLAPGGLAASWMCGLRLNSSRHLELDGQAAFGAGIGPQRVVRPCKWTAALTCSPMSLGVQASFATRLTERLQLAADWEFQPRQQEALAGVGYQYDLPAAHSTFKARLNSNLTVEATVERRLTPMPFVFTLAVAGNPQSSKYSFGLGLSTE